MSILNNAIDSIALGIEDYELASQDSRRLISCTRNIFAGILLLFKHKLSELSPVDSDEVLIKQKISPVMDLDLDTIRWVGEGKKTVDVQGIKDRFISLKLDVDWKRLEKIQRYRNDIEHYYSSITSQVVQEMISDSFLVIVKFITDYLESDPRELLGTNVYDVMKEIDEVFEQDKKICKLQFESLTYFHDEIKDVLLRTNCTHCFSNLINPLDRDVNAESTEYQCRSCDQIFSYEDFVSNAFESEFGLSHHDIANGAEDLSCECPECNGYFWYTENICVSCGHENDLVCGFCKDKVPPSEVTCFEGTCSYCNYKYEKMMEE